MNEHETAEGMDRRTLLRRAGMAGVAVWATPAVLTVGQGVAAASSLPLLGCPTTGSPPPTSLTFRFTGDTCSNSTGGAFDGTPSTPTGDNAIVGPVTITATYGPGRPNETDVQWTGVNVGHELIIGTGVNGTVTKAGSGQLNPRVTFTVSKDGQVVQVVPVHTSCSKPLYTGEKYCGFTLIDGVFP
jgi:hypothetical protein